MNRDKKRAQAINLDQPKTTPFDLERISLFYQHTRDDSAFQVIADRTFNDLDMDEVFMFLDRTRSSVGQQYLYRTLRVIPKDLSHFAIRESLIQQLDANVASRAAASKSLSRLDNTRAYFIQSLFTGEHLNKPKWYPFIPFLSTLGIGSLVATFFFPPAFLLFVFILALNFGIHFWNKRNIYSYANSIPQLYQLVKVAKTCVGLKLSPSDATIENAIREVSGISKNAYFLKFDLSVGNDFAQLGDSVLELLKASFLIEPLITFRTLEKLDLKRDSVRAIFELVGRVDEALAIHAFRASLPYYALPNFRDDVSFEASALYHPLLIDPIANDLKVREGRSCIITGSNMSGKTTFIRTIGINAILAQTINTTLAESFTAPRIRIHSAIRISDDLLKQTSYYYEEVQTISRMIEESRSATFNLFLLDELFKGTNTRERIASGKAVLSYLAENNNLVFASTHDLELTQLLDTDYDFYHFSESIEGDQLHFDYTLKDGHLKSTNAIKILALNNYPDEVINEANRLADVVKDHH